jgi:hypothetical protein
MHDRLRCPRLLWSSVKNLPGYGAMLDKLTGISKASRPVRMLGSLRRLVLRTRSSCLGL